MLETAENMLHLLGSGVRHGPEMRVERGLGETAVGRVSSRLCSNLTGRVGFKSERELHPSLVRAGVSGVSRRDRHTRGPTRSEVTKSITKRVAAGKTIPLGKWSDSLEALVRNTYKNTGKCVRRACHVSL